MLVAALTAPALPSRSVATPAPRPVTHCVTHLAEASTPIVGNFAMEEAPLWKRLAATTPNEIRVHSVTCTGGLSGKLQRNMLAGLLVVPGVAGAMTGGPLGWGLAAACAGGIAFSTGAAFWAADKLRTLGSEAPAVERTENTVVKRPSAELLKTALHENMSAFEGMQIVHLSGHGDRNEVALIPFREVGPAVEGSDLVLLDACQTAQLESMAHLAGHTRVVVGSAHSVVGWGLPLTYLLRERLPDDPRALGALVVHNNAEKPRTRSLVALDMQVFEDRLLPSLDRLGKDLGGRLDQGRREEILQALRDSESMGWRSSRIDLGSFLENLEARLPDCQAAAEARQAWQATRIAQDGETGMTLDLVAGRTAEGLPEGWSTFLTRLDRRAKPWL